MGRWHLPDTAQGDAALCPTADSLHNAAEMRCCEEQRQAGSSPEGQGVVPNKGLALPDEEGAIGGSRLDAVLCQQPLSDVPPIAPCSQLAVEPLLCGMQLSAVAHLGGDRHGLGSLWEVPKMLRGLHQDLLKLLLQHLPPKLVTEVLSPWAVRWSLEGTVHHCTRQPSPPSAPPHPHFPGRWLSPLSNRSCCWSGQSNAGSTPTRKHMLGEGPLRWHPSLGPSLSKNHKQ